jgi:5-formyltetrahydrofolate cyclo-ligase
MKFSKSDIRMAMRLRLGTQPSAKRTTASEVICARLRVLPRWQQAASVLLFVPLKDEPDVWPLIKEVLAVGRALALPRYDAARQAYGACWVRDLDRDLVTGRFGILEPVPALPAIATPAVDLVLAPGLAFDAEGHRLGRGKGYYDRLLAEVKGWRCGVTFEFQIAPEIPAEPHDVRMDGLITEEQWREFPRG